jgi:pre-mRNA-splicing factor SYF2
MSEKDPEKDGEGGDPGPSSSSASKYLDRMNRLKNLHSRRNEARKLNHAEVVEEDRRNKLPANHEARKRRQEWELEEMEKRKAAEKAGKDYDQVKLLDIQADVADKMETSKKRKKNPDHGFSTYDEVSMRQYNRLTKNISGDKNDYQKMKEAMGEEFYPTANTLIQGAHYPSEDAMNKLVDDIQKQSDKRDKFHRRRMYDPDAPIDFINERNRKFNEKIERFYGKYTDDIKQNLERGTAV